MICAQSLGPVQRLVESPVSRSLNDPEGYFMAGSESVFLINPSSGANGIPAQAGQPHAVSGGIYVMAAVARPVSLQMEGPDGATGHAN
jgi:hypothetical protein